MKTIRFLALCLLMLVAPGIGAQDTGSHHFDTIVRNAEQGDAEAQYKLGRAYEIGYPYPVFRNDAEGAKWYRLAAEQGYAAAQYSLGLRYATGDGVPQDYIQAHMWLHLAAASHDYPDWDRDEAAQMRDMIGSALSAEDLTRALALARDWKPSL